MERENYFLKIMHWELKPLFLNSHSYLQIHTNSFKNVDFHDLILLPTVIWTLLKSGERELKINFLVSLWGEEFLCLLLMESRDNSISSQKLLSLFWDYPSNNFNLENWYLSISRKGIILQHQQCQMCGCIGIDRDGIRYYITALRPNYRDVML